MHALSVSLQVLLSVGIHVFLFRAQTAAEVGTKTFSFPCPGEPEPISSQNIKYQKLSGGQGFDMHVCLHHRGGQTTDRLFIPCQKTNFTSISTISPYFGQERLTGLCCFTSCLRLKYFPTFPQGADQ